jgi:hypothetical protein
MASDFPEPDTEAKRDALSARLAELLDYRDRHGPTASLLREIAEVRAELDRLGVPE